MNGADKISQALKISGAIAKQAAPTEAQKAAGNYRKHHVRIHGLDIALENVKGGKRSGVGHNGRRWTVTMPAHYGYIKRTEGADGDHVDVYVGPDPASSHVYVVDQKDAETGKFDEHKVMLGFASEAQARATYIRGFSDGKGAQRIQSIKPMSIDQFKDWLKHEDTTKPAGREERSTGGRLDLKHAAEARKRAPGQIHPSKYMPGVPRQVHADGGKVDDHTETPEFKNWFKKSRVVDRNGKPLVVYHGTPNGDFKVFRTSQHDETALPGIAFSRHRDVAENYAHNRYDRGDGGAPNPTVIPAYIQSDNLPSIMGFYNDVEGHYGRELPDISEQEILHYAKANGIRALDTSEIGEPGEIFVLDPSAIKHATDNSGHFTPENPDITKAEGGGVDDDGGFDVYHGSPHDFDSFDVNRIGSGEGNQMFGHGLYFADSEDVARNYRNNLAAKADPKLAVGDVVHKIIRGGIQPSSKEDVLHRLWKARLEFQSDNPNDKWTPKLTNDTLDNSALGQMFPSKELKEWADKEIRGKNLELPTKGYMYHVRVKAKPEEFFDWDKPVAEQHEKVKRAIAPFFPEGIPEKDDRGIPFRGGDLYHRILHRSSGVMHGHVIDKAGIEPQVSGGSAERLSRYLHKMGVPGIRYLDAASRVRGAGTRNYVIFHHDTLDAPRKYAEGGEVHFEPPRLFHGTDHPDRIGELDPFISHDQLGVHLGDEDTANQFAKRMDYDPRANKTRSPRVIPVDAQFKKSLRLEDTNGTWEPSVVYRQLVTKGLEKHDPALEEQLTNMEQGANDDGVWSGNDRLTKQRQDEAIGIIHDMIRKHGCDSVVYLNRHELPHAASKRLENHHLPRHKLNKLSDEEFKAEFPEARDSYIALHPDQLRSPFGKGRGVGYAKGGSTGLLLEGVDKLVRKAMMTARNTGSRS